VTQLPFRVGLSWSDIGLAIRQAQASIGPRGPVSIMGCIVAVIVGWVFLDLLFDNLRN
jgi:hypothetical protein